MANKENPLVSLPPEEYLERTGVSNVLKDIVTALLENRPENPIHFINDYLKTSSSSCTGVMKSYKLIRLSKFERKSFMDNLVSAYMNLDSKRGGNNQGITGLDYTKLLKMICIDFPYEVVDEVLGILGKRDTDIVQFEEFLAGIKAILLYEDFFCEAEELFSYLDNEKTGKVETPRLLAALSKLGENKTFAMPSREELKLSLERLNIDEKPLISYGEFCLSLIKIIN
ncbi:hypothetical protein SteCoe_15994 [Stentor coeruleus]|uniref:Tubulin polyglutamylase complex subunit 1-like C-terminal domain-containing protein n=1 Tax=Stentor coeruleus TaxID=5963 RepID=A0A1R2C2D7_9CILI|nr:hypothetical protein SteCoe_15994 [Stentor coeruleus]